MRCYDESEDRGLIVLGGQGNDPPRSTAGWVFVLLALVLVVVVVWAVAR